MASIERKINGTFAPVPGGYAQPDRPADNAFRPGLLRQPATTPKPASCSATPPTMKRWKPKRPPPCRPTSPANTSTATKCSRPPPAATSPPIFPTTASIIFSALSATVCPQLHGRGISYDEQRNTYTVTTRAYDKLKEQYRIRYETCLD